MKHKITFNIYALLTFSLIYFYSCDKENELQNAAYGEKGAYARVVESTSDKSTNLFDIQSSLWNAKIEFVDEQNGVLIESYTLFAIFKDNTIESDTAPDYSILEEVQLGSWTKDQFQVKDKYPTLDFSVKSSDVIAALDLDISKADKGDSFVFRGEIALNDGRTFSDTNSSSGINSELFYNDAFSFSSPFVCNPKSPITGDWKIDMWDKNGDGWNGGYISVKINDTETKYAALETNGKDVTSVIVNVPAGTATLEWNYKSGKEEKENSFKIYAPSGNLVLDDGPTPKTGTLDLYLCKE